MSQYEYWVYDKLLHWDNNKISVNIIIIQVIWVSADVVILLQEGFCIGCLFFHFFLSIVFGVL